MHVHKITLGICIFSSVIAFTGCQSESQPRVQSEGFIARVDGEIQRVETTENSLCETHSCEPNYLYSIYFGRKRPVPNPDPPPVDDPPPPENDPPEDALPIPDLPEALTWAQQIMNVQSAWGVTQGSPQIVVAVVDTGVNVIHPDLRDNIWTNVAEEFGVVGVDDDGNGYIDDVYGYDFANDQPNGLDDNRHGTHCAGIIGASRNDFGVVGISPNIKIMPLKFLRSDGFGSTDAAIRAIEYATQMGAHVISNSWGGGGRSSLLEGAISQAIAQGVLVVAAAGNESKNNDQSPTYPAGYPGVISVASTNQSDRLSFFSNFGGSSVTIAAPGSDIVSTVLENEYESLSGTSMATPQVAGALALALSVNGNLSSVELKARLCQSASPILLGSVQCGRMDVAALIHSVLTRE